MGRSRIYSGREKTSPFAGYAGRIIGYSLDDDAAGEWASRFLPSAFVAMIDFSSGSWLAPLPEQTPPDVANRFTSGVLPEPPVSEWKAFDPDVFGPQVTERIASSLGCTVDELVEVPKSSLVLFVADWALDYLTSDPSALVLVREMHDKPPANLVQWTSEMGVFYPLGGGGRDRDAIADVMDAASVNDEEFVMLTTCDWLDPSTSLSLSDHDLTALVARAHAVFLAAYDGEGYVCWTRGSV